MMLEYKKLNDFARDPIYAKEGSACFDVSAVVDYNLYINDSFIKGVFAKDIIEVGAYNRSYVHVPDDGSQHCIVVPSGQRRIIKTGLAFNVPEGYELQIRPRSGLGFKNGVVSFWGTLDFGFVDETMICVFNFGHKPIVIYNGDRIAQCKIEKIEQVELCHVNDFDKKTYNRGGGFGSSNA